MKDIKRLNEDELWRLFQETHSLCNALSKEIQRRYTITHQRNKPILRRIK